MAYHFDVYDQSLVLDGWQNGIAPDPYDGDSNMENVNISSVPGEVSCGFSTSPEIQTPSYSGITVTAYGDGAYMYCSDSLIPKLEIRQAVYFTSSSISSVGTTSVYWIYNIGHTVGGNAIFGITNAWGSGSGISIGTTGTAVIHTFDPYFTPTGNTNKNYMISTNPTGSNIHWALDGNGLVWSDYVKTQGGTGITSTSSWTYSGNLANTTGFASAKTDAYGNGMVYLRTANSTSPGTSDGWIFIWRNSEIDYIQIEASNATIASSSITWVYGWNPSTGTTGNSTYLKTASNTPNPHEAIITPDGRVVFGDNYFIGRFYQTDSISPTNFNPQSKSTYTFNYYPILPTYDRVTSLAYLNSYVLVGGTENKIYPWDMISTQYSNPLILLPEKNISSIVSYNQTAYVFCGNRGNIYITNGSQSDLWTKIPDHISETIQPLYYWRGTAYVLNTLYFGVLATKNGDPNTIEPGYGGIWAIDINTKVIYKANISKTSSSAVPSALLAQYPNTDFSGYGVYGAFSTSPGTIEAPINTPQIDGSSFVETENIPIGTFQKPRDFQQIEYKLSKPLVSGESVSVQYRQDFSKSYTTIFTDTTTGRYSGRFPVNFKESQWIQFKIVLTSTATNPSYVRLKELRLLGITGPTLAQSPILSGT